MTCPRTIHDTSTACPHQAAGVEHAASLLTRLGEATHPAAARLAASKCGDVWATLLDAACRTGVPAAGFGVYRTLVSRGFEPAATLRTSSPLLLLLLPLTCPALP